MAIGYCLRSPSSSSPAYSLTKKRNFERLMGTLAGAFIGLLILYFIPDRTVLFVLMIFFMIGTYVFSSERTTLFVFP